MGTWEDALSLCRYCSTPAENARYFPSSLEMDSMKLIKCLFNTLFTLTAKANEMHFEIGLEFADRQDGEQPNSRGK